MEREGSVYTVIFTTILCGICSVLVASAAVGLKDRQIMNKILDKQHKILLVSGLAGAKESLSRSEIQERYKQNIETKLVNFETGEYETSLDPATFDPQRALKDPNLSKPAPPNGAGIVNMSKYGHIYFVKKGGQVEEVIIPIQGRGLWSVMYGFLALDKDLNTVRGIIFYEHGETPGLGGEIENPRWCQLWVGRKVYDDTGKVQLSVIKGTAGPPDTDPYRVDGLSGATMTSRGVTNLIQFWLSDSVYGKFLKKKREQGSL
ncbi:MAG: Na(+)-translocating NADH-quinone reductase subunit C [Candidatus Hydrogenedentes bacterium]|nr:Na(+)-translocating NADH-quinone reductase subunit C [Candidatus Hydrogenedentota bacterium]